MSDEAELAQAVGLFEAGKYAQCADELAVLLDPKSREPLRDPEVIATQGTPLAGTTLLHGCPG
jgi:hypothetical protein